MADKQFKLAFDVSTNSTGYALLDENNFIVLSGEIKTKSQHEAFGTRMAIDLETIESELSRMGGVLNRLKHTHDQYTELISENIRLALESKLSAGEMITLRKTPKKLEGTTGVIELRERAAKIKKEAFDNMEKIELIVVIEANKIQKSQDVKQKLDLYVGMYHALVVSLLNVLTPYYHKTYLLSSPTEWRNKAYGYQPERKEAKELAIENANSMLKDQKQDREVAGDDEAEAIIIATVADSLRDIATVYTRKQFKAKRVQQLKNNLVNAERYVAKYSAIAEQKEKIGKKLQKSQQTVLDNNLNKITAIKNELTKLK